MQKKKQPKDANKLAKSIVEQATADQQQKVIPKKQPKKK
jgi:hypothetical protein